MRMIMAGIETVKILLYILASVIQKNKKKLLKSSVSSPNNNPALKTFHKILFQSINLIEHVRHPKNPINSTFPVQTFVTCTNGNNQRPEACCID